MSNSCYDECTMYNVYSDLIIMIKKVKLIFQQDLLKLFSPNSQISIDFSKNFSNVNSTCITTLFTNTNSWNWLKNNAFYVRPERKTYYQSKTRASVNNRMLLSLSKSKQTNWGQTFVSISTRNLQQIFV